MRPSEHTPSHPGQSALIFAIVALIAMSFAAGLLTGRYALPRPTSAAERLSEAHAETARGRVEFLKRVNHLRGVAMATVWLATNRPEAEIPANDPLALLELLAEHDAVPTDAAESWFGQGGRAPGEPPFYILTDPNTIDPQGPAVPLIAEHPTNPAAKGGTIVWTDTRAETIENPDAYRARFQELIASAPASAEEQTRPR